MFMLLDYSPELVQVAYRIGDSTTNIISPIDVVFCSDRRLYAAIRRQGRDRHSRRHDVAYTIVFLMIWMALLTIWLLAGLPVGPGASLFL